MLPTDSAVRKTIPIYRGFIKPFGEAMAAVAQLTAVATKQHHPDGGVWWDKSKSIDELDALLRHMVDDASDPLSRDAEGVLHAVKIGWRAMANLQRLADSGVNIFAVTPPTDAEEDAAADDLVDEGEELWRATKKFAMREA